VAAGCAELSIFVTADRLLAHPNLFTAAVDFMPERRNFIKPNYELIMAEARDNLRRAGKTPRAAKSRTAKSEAETATDTPRAAISNIERGGVRISENNAVLLDSISEFVVTYFRQRLAPLESRLDKLERAMGARGEE